MTLKSTTRLFHLRFVQGGFPAEEGQYGSDLYGSPDFTYGQLVGEDALIGLNYVVLPVSSSHPDRTSWFFRVGDTAKSFVAQIIPESEPQKPMSLGSVAAATLFLNETSSFTSEFQRLSFDLSIDKDNSHLVYSFEPGDLHKPGYYNVQIRVLFNSGRYMTIEAAGESTLSVEDRTIELTNNP